MYKVYNYDKMIEAIFENNLELVKELCQEDIDIHHDDEYALCLAAQYGYYDIVGYICDLGADIHANDDCVVKIAAETAILTS